MRISLHAWVLWEEAPRRELRQHCLAASGGGPRFHERRHGSSVGEFVKKEGADGDATAVEVAELDHGDLITWARLGPGEQGGDVVAGGVGVGVSEEVRQTVAEFSDDEEEAFVVAIDGEGVFDSSGEGVEVGESCGERLLQQWCCVSHGGVGKI